MIKTQYMPKTIVQKVVFKNTSPKTLYNLYMDAKKHAAATGAPAKITAKAGAKYAVSDGYITGRNLQLVKDKLIVQSWRAADWDKTDGDSTFIIHIEPKGKDSVLNVTHANVPDKHAKSIAGGWHTYYWKPWKQYLAGKAITPPPAM
jgi:activator of HSP90 ATPase